MKKRIIEFDCARALAMMYIIGFWHLRHYTFFRLSSIPYAETIGSFITIGALCTFTFISAFFLGNNIIHNKDELINFFKRRFLRLYPLFIISCFSLFYISISFFKTLGQEGYFESYNQLALTLLGLGCFAPQAPLTVWYASMIIFFYFITPFVLYKIEQRLQLSIGILVIIFIFICMNSLIWRYFSVDSRFFEHYIIYFLVLILSHYHREVILRTILNNKFYLINTIIVLGLLPIAGIMYRLKGNLSESFIVHIFVIYFGTIVFLAFARLLAKVQILNKALSFISYTSMTCYLFHRQYFEIIAKIFGKFSTLLAILALFSLIIISFYIQKLYDWIIIFLLNKKDKNH